MTSILSEGEQDRDQQRSVILALAGFSFSGVLALVLLDAAANQPFQLGVYFLLLSFLGYLWSFNLQGYKSRRWQGELALALLELGALSLILALISIIWASSFGQRFKIAMSALGIGIWCLDHLLRLNIEIRYLRDLRGCAE